MKKIGGFIMKAKDIYFYIATVILVVLISFLIKGSALSMEKNSFPNKGMESYYRTIEADYTAEIRSFLNGKGYLNAGISLNRRISESGKREYTLVINHRRFSSDEFDKELFAKEISEYELMIPESEILIMTTY